MKFRKLLIAGSLLVSLAIGCSKNSAMTAAQKITDLGIVEVEDGKSSSHVLADGRNYVLTPTILPGRHKIQLETRITYTNAEGRTHIFTMTSFFNPNQTTIYGGESNSLISVTLHTP